MLYVINVTEGRVHVNTLHSNTVPSNTKLKAVLNNYKDRFPTELPPPESNAQMHHTIPLKSNEPPPLRKSHHPSRPEVAELNIQVALLLEKGYIQPSNSTYNAASGCPDLDCVSHCPGSPASQLLLSEGRRGHVQLLLLDHARCSCRMQAGLPSLSC